MTSIYVGVCAWRSVEALHQKCVLQLLKTPGIIYDLKDGDALIDRQRAIVATRFLLETKADVLVTIDSDILFEPQDVLTIAEQAMSHDIVAGLYVTRSSQRCIPTSHFMAEQPIVLGTPGLQPIKWAASGFTAYHRRVFEALAEYLPLCHPKESWRFYPFYTPFAYEDEEAGMIYLSEDWALAQRAREKGFGCYLSQSVTVRHLGMYPYSTDDLLRQVPNPNSPMKVTRQRGEGARYVVEIEDPIHNFPEGPLIPPMMNRAERRRMEREKVHA